MSDPSARPAPRIERLHRLLVREIPRFPNNRASRDHMEAKPLGDLMIDYLSWRSRYVGVRPRTVTVEPAARATSTWNANGPAIEALIAKAKRGEDLTPHLSLKPHSQGYTPAARAPGAAAEERWSDKDFILNTMHYHHFHLGAHVEDKGHMARTDEIVLARVSRDAFDIVAIFDHEVFDHGSPERLRLWAIHDEIADRGTVPGTLAAGPMIATSGHPLHLVLYANRCRKLIRELDSKLDQRGFMAGLYDEASWPAPAKFKPEWLFDHLDFGIYDRAGKAMFLVAKGWN